jgi:hypothetical protein
MPTKKLQSVPGVAHYQSFVTAEVRTPYPNLLIEVAHGATRAVQLQYLMEKLQSTLPEGLSDFFHVNTDAGAPEAAIQTALALLEIDPKLHIGVLSSEIPRTLVDVNRVLDIDPAAYKEGKVTPGLPPYIQHPDDVALLSSLHRQYVELLDKAVERIAEHNGVVLMLHSYAPRSVDVQVDADIVKSLRAAYQPEVEPTWPLRPEVDVICRSVEGELKIPESLVSSLQTEFSSIGLAAADGKTYPLHPSTQAARLAEKYPGRCLCVEVRRDLLCSPWVPFEEQEVGWYKAARVGGALARVLKNWYQGLQAGL